MATTVRAIAITLLLLLAFVHAADVRARAEIVSLCHHGLEHFDVGLILSEFLSCRNRRAGGTD